MTDGTSAGVIAAVIGALPFPALLADAEGTVLQANTPAREAFGADPAGHGVSLFLRAPAVVAALRDAVTNGTAANVDYTRHGLHERNFDVHVAPLRLTDSGSHVLITFRDTTREEQIERMRSDFVANASHELRTPLATLSGFIETMQGPARDDPAAREKFLGVMRTQAERMSRLIDDLLSLSRIEISEHVAPDGEADLAAIARQACQLLEQMAAQAGCELAQTLNVPLPVTGDARELLQVTHNLIENAIKYGGCGGKVEIKGHIERGRALLDVRDFGPGIAAHHVPRLTERFYRVNVQDSRTRGGTGLGLAIVKHIVNRHRGKMTITSEIGRGSCFSISLPLKKT